MVESISLKVYGMTCTLCSLAIESAITKLDGVKKIDVSYAAEKAKLEYDSDTINLDEIKRRIELLGFSINQRNSGELTSGQIERNKLRNNLIVAIILSFPLILAMILGGVGFCHSNYNLVTATRYGSIIENLRYRASSLHDWKLQMTLATLTQFTVGLTFYKNAFFAIRAKCANMDLLVVIGTSAAYFYSVYISFFQTASYTLGMSNIYFEASSTIITLVLLGKYLELIAKNKTSMAIENLVKLKPKKVRVIRENEEVTISADEVLINDIVVVKPGEKVAVDGIIIEGYSTVDESMMTGESMPVLKKVHDFVTGASINKNGTFKFRATKVGNDTVLANIIKLVDEAQESKAPIQKIVDRVASYFVPAVLIIAALTFIIWYVFIYDMQTFIIDEPIIYAVSVLVVSCPCALGLATPAAIMVGIGKGAENGILIKNGEDLETACKINTIVFDKTGTITTGKFQVTDVILNSANKDIDEYKLLKIVAKAEKQSEHPLGSAIYEYAVDKYAYQLDGTDKFESIPGMGITANLGKHTVVIGSRQFLLRNNIEFEMYEKTLSGLNQNNKNTVLIAIDNEFAGIIALSDQIKSDAKKSIKELEAIGIEVYMITGDSNKIAQSVAKEVGIKNVVSEVHPKDKADAIIKLKEKGKIVAMVGDGINDAPALASADIGFAMGTGTDVAIETGDIVLLRGELKSIVSAIKLSKSTMRKIKQNLFWAFCYNIIAIPIAASGHLNPVVGALAMSFSSVSVLLNSLSLRIKKIY